MADDWEVRGEAKPELVQIFMEVVDEKMASELSVHIRDTYKNVTTPVVAASMGLMFIENVMALEEGTYEDKMNTVCSYAAYLLATLTAAMQKEMEDEQTRTAN